MSKGHPSKQLPKITRKQKVGLVLAAILFLIPYLFEAPGLSPIGHRMLSIFLMAIALWITEAIPLFATAALIIFLEAILVSDSAILAIPAGFDAPSYSLFFHTLADPILMLFLGGFFLADGASRFSLDKNLTRVFIQPFGTSPPKILLGVMLITAVFSMFMSNTATTATLMAVILPVVSQLSKTDRFRTGLVLGVPIAANVGGMGTPIGTPPNAIALGALNQGGYGIGFLTWMVMLIPLVLVVLFFSWRLLLWFYPAETSEIRIEIKGEFDRSKPAVIFYATFAVTVLLWVTEAIHGMSSSVVGFFPVVILLCTRVFDQKNLQSMPWHVLWLVAGGIALGKGVGATGLDLWMIGLVNWDTLSPGSLVALLSLISLVIGTFISHSATANLVIPIGTSLALSGAVDLSPVEAGVCIAVGCSLAMALPISTPPNAIAFATGTVGTKDLAKTGVLISLFGWAIYVLFLSTLWKVLGLIQ